MLSPTSPVSPATVPSVKWLASKGWLGQGRNGGSTNKDGKGGGGPKDNEPEEHPIPCLWASLWAGEASGTETCGLNQPDLVATRCEFAALITLDHNTATGFDPDDPGANPTQSRGLQNFDHITGLKIQLHARNKETTNRGCIGRAVEDLNPRHQVLETCVLPAELTAQDDAPMPLPPGQRPCGEGKGPQRSKRCLTRVALPTRSRR